MSLRVLFQDSCLVAIDKPFGYHVHPPEDPAIQISDSRNCLAILRRQLGQYLYPLHRIDSPTTGVVLFALDPETARQMGLLFQSRLIQKTYYCVTRGWVEPQGVFERPLKSESDPATSIPAATRFYRLAQVELPFAVGRYPTARYSLVQAEPLTGRFHQIRRHFNGDSHPLIGDSIYGDGPHNRLFREKLQIPSLLLKAQAVKFPHPQTGESVQIVSRWTGKWHRVFDLFGICPTRYA